VTRDVRVAGCRLKVASAKIQVNPTKSDLIQPKMSFLGKSSRLFLTEVLPEAVTWGCRFTLTLCLSSRSVFVQFLTENADILP